jgi:hypothetical protein
MACTREFVPRIIPLPHPSWRNNGWLWRNAWFEAELLPELRREIIKVAHEFRDEQMFCENQSLQVMIDIPI